MLLYRYMDIGIERDTCMQRRITYLNVISLIINVLLQNSTVTNVMNFIRPHKEFINVSYRY